MSRFQRTIDLPKRLLFGKVVESNEDILSGFTSKQLNGIKNLAKRKEIEGALDELERARPIIDQAYYQNRRVTLQRKLSALETAKKQSVVEIRVVRS